MNGGNPFDCALQFPNVWVRYHRGLTDLAFKIQMKNKELRRGGLIIIWGKAGTGKSYAARYNISKQLGLTPNDIYSLPIGMNKNPWFDGYAGEKILLIDDYQMEISKKTYLWTNIQLLAPSKAALLSPLGIGS